MNTTPTQNPLPNPVIAGPDKGKILAVHQHLQEQARHEAEQSAMWRTAAATPLPGITAEAFKIPDAIPVGDYTVRAFCDRDFEIMQGLEHPLYLYMANKEATEDYIPRGPQAWNISYLMTHPIKEIKELIKTEGYAGLKQRAADEFDECQIIVLISISEAIIKQMTRYWSPVLKFGQNQDDGGGQTTAPFDSAPSLTGTGGS